VQQVEMGVAVRMAVLKILMENNKWKNSVSSIREL
jgi:aspartate carbamoyltransferase catalytic subunit